MSIDELGRSHPDGRVLRPTASVEPCFDPDGEAIAVLLYTSGTTAAPKAAVLRHRHLTSYVITSVEFVGADETDATLVSVPPYHVAGVANVVSNIYAGAAHRLPPAASRPTAWLETVRDEGDHQRHGRAHDAGPRRRLP